MKKTMKTVILAGLVLFAGTALILSCTHDEGGLAGHSPGGPNTYTPAGGSGGNGGGGGGFDSALVAKWHSTQDAADSETSAVFEFTSDGKMILAGNATEFNVTTSGGHIKATLTMSGQTVDAGEADYVVAGTTLAFSNFSGGPPNYFSTLTDALTSLAALGGDGKFHKKAGGGSEPTSIKPAKLSPSATAQQANAKLDAIIAYPGTPGDIREEAEWMKDEWSYYSSNWSSMGAETVAFINSLIDDIP
jgi:hypothetical protein